MEAVTVDEAIRVGVAFENKKAIPVWFRWRDRQYKVKAVSYTWSTNQGLVLLRHFAVTDGVNSYELCFNTRTMEWTLGKILAGSGDG